MFFKFKRKKFKGRLDFFLKYAIVFYQEGYYEKSTAFQFYISVREHVCFCGRNQAAGR